MGVGCAAVDGELSVEHDQAEYERVEQDVLALLAEEHAVLQHTRLAHDTSLVASGLLDSFAVVMLIASLEERFAVEFDVETLDLDAFETPRAIAGLCLALGAAAS